MKCTHLLTRIQGWNYVFQWAVVLPLELTVCGLTVQYWNPDISVAVWISVFLVFIVIVNVFGTLGYAEEEFWSSCLKLAATIIFMIIALVCVLGGGPSNGNYSEYWGARLWYDPGAFRNGFRGFCSVFVTAAFAFSGTELVGLAAAESENPVKSLPGAIKQVFWRITLFYILGLFFVGLLIDSTDTNLLGANPYADVNASPFVLVGKYAGLRGFDSFMNVIILVSVVSIGVSGVYGGSRTLTALAQQGYAPKVFTCTYKLPNRPNSWTSDVALVRRVLSTRTHLLTCSYSNRHRPLRPAPVECDHHPALWLSGLHQPQRQGSRGLRLAARPLRPGRALHLG